MADKDGLELEEEEGTAEKGGKKKFQMPKLPKLPGKGKKAKAKDADEDEDDGKAAAPAAEKKEKKPKEKKEKPKAEKPEEKPKAAEGASLAVKIMMGVVGLLAVILIVLVIIIVRANSGKQEAVQAEMESNLEQAALEAELQAAQELQAAAQSPPTPTPAPSVDVILDLIPEVTEPVLEKMTLYMPGLVMEGQQGADAAALQIPAESPVSSMTLSDGKRYVAAFDDIIYTNYLAAKDAQAKLKTAYAQYTNESIEKEALMTYCEEVLSYQHDVTARVNNGGNANAAAYITACEDYLYLARNSAAELIDCLKANESEELLALAEDTISQTDLAAPAVTEARRSYLFAEGFTEEEIGQLKN